MSSKSGVPACTKTKNKNGTFFGQVTHQNKNREQN